MLEYQYLSMINFDENMNTKCLCLGSYCIKRRYSIMNILTQMHEDITICNSVLKLMFQNVQSSYTNLILGEYIVHIAKNVAEKSIGKEIKFGSSYQVYAFEQNLFHISYMVSKKPFGKLSISLKELVNIYANLGESTLYDTWDMKYYMSKNILDNLQVIHDRIKLKKNMKIKTELSNTLKRIKRNYSIIDMTQVNEIIIGLFESTLL